MKIGFVFAPYEIENTPNAIRDYVQAAEGMGYEYLLTYEHVLGANPNREGGWNGPYTYEHAFHDPFVLFGFLAGLTQTIEFVTGILILPQRQTAVVAKQAAEVDILSNGRLRLGIGIGWNKVEMESLGFDFHNRGKRVEEQVDLLRKLWTTPLVQFSGQYHFIDDAGINPPPVQKPIPIWFGGGADTVLKRMAQIGDGWIPNTTNLDVAQEHLQKLHQYLKESGRDPQKFGIDVRVNLKSVPQNQWAIFVQKWREMGATHLCVNTLGLGFTEIDEHIEMLRKFKETVL